ncbi:hypothetical protein L6164_015241 [Bauhinia variegata]|uniref:Uncharacterized protein n=1 Tax=Bauhinia variegata TaxID=167791 RepID=A0ACB9NL12_BAUVA|nr:hypothetical protein L6164_015241 [Bauhinia variegata]
MRTLREFEDLVLVLALHWFYWLRKSKESQLVSPLNNALFSFPLFLLEGIYPEGQSESFHNYGFWILIATPYYYGAGELTTGPLQPGLVSEITTTDYLNYLCFIGLDITSIKVISKTVSDGFTCPKDSNADMISNINYPSIAISNFNAKETKNVTRTVSNVGGDDQTVYSSVVDAPSGVTVKVTPDKLQFTKSSNKLSYQVVFALTSTLKEDAFGSITWTNGKYTVRSPFVLSGKSNIHE